MENLEKEIVANKQLRKDLDEKLQELNALPGSRERSLARTYLEQSIMWLGQDLKRLGAVNPYPSSKDPSTGSVVEPTADGLKFSNMGETFLDRLKQEHKELDDKVCKLSAFFKTEGFFNIGEANKVLLKEQLEVMTKYLNILTVRLELLKK